MDISYRRYPSELSFQLPPSKSILARIVLLRLVEEVAYGRVFSYHGLEVDDPSEDVAVMLRFADYFHRCIYPFKSTGEVFAFDCGESGTALRLLTTFCSALPIDIRLTAQGHLNHRPMEELLQVLEGWGASFDFEGNRKYFAPFIVHGTTLTPSDIISTKNWRSSQFVSALILCSPLMASDFSIHRSQNEPSSEYITLTISVMSNFGYGIDWTSNNINIRRPTKYSCPNDYSIESDWSSATYWYEFMLLHPEVHLLHLEDLRLDSAHPDAVCSEFFSHLGICTLPTTKGVFLRSGGVKVSFLTVDCSQCPDLFPALFCALIGAGMSFEINGLELLRFKESNRIQAMLDGAEALGYTGFVMSGDTISWDALPRLEVSNALIRGYSDHRVVMAFGVLATSLCGTRTQIEDHTAVAKSYPTFFTQLLQGDSLI